MTYKNTLRREMLRKRDSFDAKLLDEYNKSIYKRLLTDKNMQNAETVMTYVNIGSEPDTRRFISGFISAGGRIAVPVVNGRALVVSYINSLSDLETGTFGVPEPKKSCFSPCTVTDIDAVIVPGAAFDAKGHRIGYGAGFYDRFLPKVKAVKIGLCYSFCLVDDTFPEEHDIPVDCIITELENLITRG